MPRITAFLGTAIAVFVLLGSVVAAQHKTLRLKIEDVMTADELKNSGVSRLTVSQREALNDWLNRYTVKVLNVALSHPLDEPSPPKSTAASTCAPAVESTMEGDFNG